jgi:hypothetical protein
MLSVFYLTKDMEERSFLLHFLCRENMLSFFFGIALFPQSNSSVRFNKGSFYFSEYVVGLLKNYRFKRYMHGKLR